MLLFFCFTPGLKKFDKVRLLLFLFRSIISLCFSTNFCCRVLTRIYHGWPRHWDCSTSWLVLEKPCLRASPDVCRYRSDRGGWGLDWRGGISWSVDNGSTHAAALEKDQRTIRDALRSGTGVEECRADSSDRLSAHGPVHCAMWGFMCCLSALTVWAFYCCSALLERFRDRQTTDTNNTCGWAVFLHVDFRFRGGHTDETNTN